MNFIQAWTALSLLLSSLARLNRRNSRTRRVCVHIHQWPYWNLCLSKAVRHRKYQISLSIQLNINAVQWELYFADSKNELHASEDMTVKELLMKWGYSSSSLRTHASEWMNCTPRRDYFRHSVITVPYVNGISESIWQALPQKSKLPPDPVWNSSRSLPSSDPAPSESHCNLYVTTDWCYT